MSISIHELGQYWDRKIFISLAAIILVTLVATGASLFFINEVLQTRQTSIRITTVQTQLSSFYLQMLDAETGQRGYLLTGDNSYLGPYQDALTKIPAAGGMLAKLSKPYGYESQVIIMQAIAKDKLNELSQTVDAYRNAGPSAALAIVQTGRGKRDMDELRQQLASIGAQQSRDLAANRALTTKYGIIASGIGVTMFIVVGLLAFLVYYLFIQAIKSERALDKAKDEFVSLASHQLRTPASGIKAILSLLAAEDAGPLNKMQHHLVSRAADTNERELRIVDELLYVARAESGSLVLNPAKTDVRQIVAEVVSQLSTSTELKNQKLTIDQPSHSVWIVCDKEKLYMAISNLVDNASKYTPQDGNIHMTVVEKNGTVSVKVADDGAGMAKSDAAHIFERFSRSEAAIRSGLEGTGLGLYLAQEVARLHKGSIAVESVEGKGSTFTISLPRQGTQDAS